MGDSETVTSGMMRREGGVLVFDFRKAVSEGISLRAPFVVRRCRRCGQLGERHDANGLRMRPGSDYVHVLRCAVNGSGQKALQRCFVPETGFPAVGDVFEDTDTEGDVSRDLEVIALQDEQESWQQATEADIVAGGVKRWAKVKNLATNRVTKMNGWRLVEEPRFVRMEKKAEESAPAEIV